MPASEALEVEFFAMGSPCSMWLYAGDRPGAARIADAAIAEVQRLERLYSRYLADSVLSDINRAARVGGSLSVDPETATLIDHAFRAHARSGGLFDVTSGRLREIWNDDMTAIPQGFEIAPLLASIGLDKVTWRRPMLSFTVAGMELDLGGLAKEYATDRAAALCKALGSSHGLVNLGGDIAIIGPHPDGSPWRIGIRDPFGDAAIATLFVTGGGIATSGDYERYWMIDGRRFSHLLNPKTGWPVDGLPSITVAADSCLAAGTASTIAGLKGEAGPEWLRAIGAAHLYVDASGTIGGSIRLDRQPDHAAAAPFTHCETASSIGSCPG